ncbi:hypothetical protein Zmor_018305 [Zophobas morio]|uniref:Gustatory receptor n=1 Tax=Zophobas morio TaxID=2755281 RepID=A0AA38MDD7_9CUCU|nr:hypothetical protein Zmor_018305 [Zophobas morio]
MGSPLLKIILQTGRLFAISPAIEETNLQTQISKLYSLSIFTTLTAILIFSVSTKVYNIKLGILHLIVTHLNQLIIHAFTFLVMIVLNVWKRNLWLDFLKTISKQEVQHGKKVRYYFGFFLVQGLYWVQALYYGYVRITTLKNWYFVLTLALFLYEQYLPYYFAAFLYVVIRMFLKRYQEFNKVLLAMGNKNAISLQFVKSLEREIVVLKKTVDNFSDMFGWPVVFMVISTTVSILYTIELMYYPEEDEFTNNNPVRSAWSITYVATKVIYTINLLLMCDYVVQEGKRTVLLTYDLRWRLRNTSNQDRQELYEFTKVVSKNVPIFTAAGLFELGRPMVFQVAGIVFTYSIILIQFH